jgi:hypothetical protein
LLTLVEESGKLWVKRLSGISLVLIIIFVASYSHSTESIVEKMDVDRNHLVKLEAGEQATVELSKVGYYIAIRHEGDSEDEKPELKLTDSEGTEIEGRSPGIIESNNKRPDSQGKLIYIPIRVFEINNNGNYNLINQGNTTLWLVDDLEVQSSLMSDRWIMTSMISCCLGFPLGIFSLIMGLILWRRNSRSSEQKITLQENIMTTDELFKKHNSIVETKEENLDQKSIYVEDDQNEINEEKVPAPFVATSNKWEEWDDGE